MKGFVVAVMLLAFLIGLGYTTSGRLSKKYNEDPWAESKVSQDKDLDDPWSDSK